MTIKAMASHIVAIASVELMRIFATARSLYWYSNCHIRFRHSETWFLPASAIFVFSLRWRLLTAITYRKSSVFTNTEDFFYFGADDSTYADLGSFSTRGAGRDRSLLPVAWRGWHFS